MFTASVPTARLPGRNSEGNITSSSAAVKEMELRAFFAGNAEPGSMREQEMLCDGMAAKKLLSSALGKEKLLVVIDSYTTIFHRSQNICTNARKCQVCDWRKMISESKPRASPGLGARKERLILSSLISSFPSSSWQHTFFQRQK